MSSCKLTCVIIDVLIRPSSHTWFQEVSQGKGLALLLATGLGSLSRLLCMTSIVNNRISTPDLYRKSRSDTPLEAMLATAEDLYCSSSQSAAAFNFAQ